MFFLAEYSNIIVISSFCVLLFLGGWVIYIVTSALMESFVFSSKVTTVLVFFILVRAALPRYRFDQLMSFG